MRASVRVLDGKIGGITARQMQDRLGRRGFRVLNGKAGRGWVGGLWDCTQSLLPPSHSSTANSQIPGGGREGGPGVNGAGGGANSWRQPGRWARSSRYRYTNTQSPGGGGEVR
jgi:hypothetical protein